MTHYSLTFLKVNMCIEVKSIESLIIRRGLSFQDSAMLKTTSDANYLHGSFCRYGIRNILFCKQN